jgi:hypothetical protein
LAQRQPGAAARRRLERLAQEMSRVFEPLAPPVVRVFAQQGEA